MLNGGHFAKIFPPPRFGSKIKEAKLRSGTFLTAMFFFSCGSPARGFGLAPEKVYKNVAGRIAIILWGKRQPRFMPLFISQMRGIQKRQAKRGSF